MDAKDLVEKLEAVKEGDLETIFSKINASKSASDSAAERVVAAERDVEESRRLRGETEKLLDERVKELEGHFKENDARLTVAKSLAESAATSLDAISGKTCGVGSGSGCDAECGGIGCADAGVECGGKKGSKCDGSMRWVFCCCCCCCCCCFGPDGIGYYCYVPTS